MFLGLDVGTTAVKALVIDERLRPVAEGAAGYPTFRPHPTWSEQSAEDWWSAAVAATRQALRASGLGPLRALAVSTQGDTLVPLDAAGKPLAPARTWMDTRTASLIPALEAALPPDRWYQTTGSRLGPYSAAMTIAWLREHNPDAYRAAARFSLVADFAIPRLTGAPALDHPNASRTLLFDIRSRDWAPALLAAVGVDLPRLSPTMPSGTLAGTLTPAAAAELGLPPGIPVVLGGHDQTCAAVGAGVVRPGTMLLSCGTAWVQLAAADEPLLDGNQRRVQTYCHAAPDRWALLTAHAGGNVLAWLRDTLYGDESVTFDQITADAASAVLPLSQASCARERGLGGEAAVASVAAVTSSLITHHSSLAVAVPLPLLLPHFYGAMWPESLRHAQGALLGFTLSTTRAQIAASVLQGVALEVARNYAALCEMGAQPSEVRMIGGGAHSDLWAQMVADATGAVVVRPQVREAAAFGAAILAGVGAGLLPPVDEAVADIPVCDTRQPDPGMHDHYAALQERFTEATEALAPLWQRLQGAPE